MTTVDALRQLYGRCLAAIDLESILPERVNIDRTRLRAGGLAVDFDDFDEAVVIAIGKASEPLADFVAPRLTLPTRGVVVGPGSRRAPSGWVGFRGGHPAPDLESFRAAEAIARELQRVGERTLLLFLLSGGGSAMVEQPIDPTITVSDCQRFHRALVECGAPIEAINAIRKHTSAVKGGRLAEAAVPARQVTLFVSDVPPGSPSAVASGPTFPDETTIEDCRRVLAQYALLERLPSSYRPTLEALIETPKPGAACFDRSSFVKLLDNNDALDALEREAAVEGWRVERLELSEEETIESAVDAQLGKLGELRARFPHDVVGVSSGGEVNCPVGEGAGIGGRSLALALALALRIEGEPIAFLSASTDGVDGNSPASGAVVDGATAAAARSNRLDLQAAFDHRDAFTALEALGCVIVTGPTGNNVRDVRLLIAEPSKR